MDTTTMARLAQQGYGLLIALGIKIMGIPSPGQRSAPIASGDLKDSIG